MFFGASMPSAKQEIRLDWAVCIVELHSTVCLIQHHGQLLKVEKELHRVDYSTFPQTVYVLRQRASLSTLH